MPVEQIIHLAKRNGIIFLLDASQGAGALPIDMALWDADMLAAPGHKSLLGPQGTGFLYVKEGIPLQHLKQGGTGSHSQMLDQPREFPDGFEAGTINAPGIIGLGASVAYINRIGADSIRDYEAGLIKQLDSALRDMRDVVVYGPEDCSFKTGIVAFNLKSKGCEEVAEELDSRFDIAVRAGYHCAPLAHKTIGTGQTGAVRASVGLFTTKEEITRTIQAINRIQKSS
jgi:selenocysteine lyase/cysteine desulfurase